MSGELQGIRELGIWMGTVGMFLLFFVWMDRRWQRCFEKVGDDCHAHAEKREERMISVLSTFNSTEHDNTQMLGEVKEALHANTEALRRANGNK
tara:strand:- start:1116 stop:1397 length:282 start_codon:yes stop_codon:yes gene_type:complete